MATTMAAPQHREKVTFEPNVPVTVTMRYPEGKIVSGRFGDQVMYSLEGNQVMFLDLPVAQKINILEPQPGESICICKRWNGERGQRVVWDVWLSPGTEKTRAARSNPELADQLRKSITQANEARYSGAVHGPIAVPKETPAASPGTAATAPAAPVRPVTGGDRTKALVAEANDLVDAFAEVLDRALTTYQGRVKPEEVRSLLLSAYIQRGKAGAYAG